MPELPAVDAYLQGIDALLHALGIAPTLMGQRGLTLHREPDALVLAHTSDTGREFFLTPQTAAAWHAMQTQAQRDGIPLALVSAFRSVARQREIIEEKLAAGLSIDQILESVAPPGYSEHHTGRAIDIASSEADALEEIFESTPSFAWLQQHAHRFGFSLSYPRNNTSGFVYEPWHWCYYDEWQACNASVYYNVVQRSIPCHSP